MPNQAILNVEKVDSCKEPDDEPATDPRPIPRHYVGAEVGGRMHLVLRGCQVVRFVNC